MKKTNFTKKTFIKFSIVVAISLFVAILVLPLVSQDSIYNQFEKYQRIFNLAVKEYFEDVDVVKLNEGGIKGMLQELDPHSTYITAKDMKDVNEDMSGSFEGIGVSFTVVADSLVVESPIPDGPSEKVGILARDRIVKANDISMINISTDSIRKVLKGPKGTTVKLEVYRPATKSKLNFVVTRDRIPIYSVDSYFVIEGTDIGYLRINRYSHTTHEEVIQATDTLRKKGMKKLILDLRGNGGGLLDQAYYLCDEFLKEDTIVYTIGRKKTIDQAYVAQKGNRLEDIPLIVLIDGGTASASEITAGSIQDLDRGLVVGTTSFGKGLVQRQYPIYSDGSAVRLTIARYYTASGRCIQRPFKDKEHWKKLTDRLELEEGANLEHTLDKIKKEEAANVNKDKKKSKKNDKSINLDSIEVFYTRSGRPVLGGGGITPDYVIKYDDRKLSSLTTSLWGNSVYIELIDKYIAEMKEKYGTNFKKFNEEFKLTDKMIETMKQIAASKDIEWNDAEFTEDREFIEVNNIKALFARSTFNANAAKQVMIPTDRQLKKAMELFPLAEKIQASKKKR